MCHIWRQSRSSQMRCLFLVSSGILDDTLFTITDVDWQHGLHLTSSLGASCQPSSWCCRALSTGESFLLKYCWQFLIAALFPAKTVMISDDFKNSFLVCILMFRTWFLRMPVSYVYASPLCITYAVVIFTRWRHHVSVYSSVLCEFVLVTAALVTYWKCRCTVTDADWQAAEVRTRGVWRLQDTEPHSEPTVQVCHWDGWKPAALCTNREPFSLWYVLLWSPYVIGQTIIFSSCFFLLSSSFFFSSPNLSGWKLDVYHTLAHDVALLRI